MAKKGITTIDVLLQENQDKELIAAKFTVFNLARDANNSFIDIYFKERKAI
ncbi:hypothetical protein INT80_06385 [Gallibacterium anatis]|uniref:Uncharacterized protein n=1 Tax=Gallibacterium anatis TaxID=750 RepID=A0A930UW02_9PAST|nr:hypothetical protein [Gallibacterium anatis]